VILFLMKSSLVGVIDIVLLVGIGLIVTLLDILR
jgi:hypothetical protein